MNTEKTEQRLAGFGLASAAAFFFALLDVAVRDCAPFLNVWQIIFARSLLSVAVMALVAGLFGLDLLGRQRKLLLLAGLAGGAGVVCLTAAILLLPLYQALVLLYLYPLFAAVISPAITGDRFHRGDGGAMALGLAGTALVLWPGDLDNHLAIGHILGLVAAACYAVAATLIRRVMGSCGPLTPIFYIMVVAGLACALPACLTPLPMGTLPATGMLALGAVTLFGILAYLAGNLALVLLPAPTVGVISMLEVVFSAGFGFLLFDEVVGPMALAGGALILASGLFLTLRPALKTPRTDFSG